MIVPVNGKTYSMMYAWNTVHRRDVTVWPDKIVFGAGYERTSKYIMITATASTFFSLQSPGTDGWEQNPSVCIPRQLFGFM